MKSQNNLVRTIRSFALAGLVALASGCGNRVIYEGNIEGRRVKLLEEFPFIDPVWEKLEITTSNGTTYIIEGIGTNCFGYMIEIDNGLKKFHQYYPTRTDEITNIWGTYHNKIKKKQEEIEQENRRLMIQKKNLEDSQMDRIKSELLGK